MGPLIIVALAAAVPQGSALALLSDKQLCDLLDKKGRQMAGSKFGQATVAAVQTDCGARTIHADYSLNFTVYDQPLYISNFMAVARGGICITDDPTMVEFNRRGWAFYLHLHIQRRDGDRAEVDLLIRAVSGTFARSGTARKLHRRLGPAEQIALPLPAAFLAQACEQRPRARPHPPSRSARASARG